MPVPIGCTLLPLLLLSGCGKKHPADTVFQGSVNKKPDKGQTIKRE